MKSTFNFQGIDCISCANKLENKIKKIDGVNKCNINFFMETLDLDYNNEESLKKVYETCLKFESGVKLFKTNN